MIKQLIFGRGQIADRIKLDYWYCRPEFRPRSITIGIVWNLRGHVFDAWLYLIPCLPLHLCLMWHDLEQ